MTAALEVMTVPPKLLTEQIVTRQPTDLLGQRKVRRRPSTKRPMTNTYKATIAGVPDDFPVVGILDIEFELLANVTE